MAKRMRKNYTFISGVVLLIALAMLFVNVPLIDEKSIAKLTIFIVAIFLLIK